MKNILNISVDEAIMNSDKNSSYNDNEAKSCRDFVFPHINPIAFA